MRIHRAKLLGVLGLMLLIAILSTLHFAVPTEQHMLSLPDHRETEAQAKECSRCHEMRPEVLTWQVSAHAKFACTVCHLNKNAADFTEEHASQSYSKPIKIKSIIPNSVCLRCHSANRVISPSGDVRIPHQKHLKAGIACVTCHYGVVHGKIAERDLTSILPDPTNYDAWNLTIAQKVLSDYYRKPDMWTCLNCHTQRNVTRKCGACHTTIAALPSHDQANWATDHGKYAPANLQSCINCHATPDLPIFIEPGTGDKATDFARAQKFCYKCHLQRPKMHQQSMIPIHPKLVAQKGIQNCLTCHDENKPKANERVPQVYCNMCHWFTA